MAISLSTRSGSDLVASPPSYFYFAYLPSSINEKDDKHCDGRGSDASDLCQQLNASLHTALDATRSGPDSFVDLKHGALSLAPVSSSVSFQKLGP